MDGIILGDALEELRKIESESVDSLVTDPPAGISFMGRSWDSDKGGRDQWIKWLSEILKETLRVLKPGAHGLIWAIPRTSHWTAMACEEAGFEIRDVITHLFGSGFPKSLSIDKAIDKAAGAEREVIGNRVRLGDSKSYTDDRANAYHGNYSNQGGESKITAPATDAAKQWQGWGTALKPASEHWILVRKPLGEKTVAANVIKHGTGAINIDASRISTNPTDPNIRINPTVDSGDSSIFGIGNGPDGKGPELSGRFPANLILSHLDTCVEVGTKKVKAIKGGNSKAQQKDIYGKFNAPLDGKDPGYGDADGTETVSAWECTDGCAVAELDLQTKDTRAGKPSGSARCPVKRSPAPTLDQSQRELKRIQTYETGEVSGASRFFYVAKASKSERNAGCEDMDGNKHPTVKSLKLMSYLIKMITPPGGTCLDPFMGSGSTGVAAVKNGFRFLGIEREFDYIEIAKARITHASLKS